MWLLVYGPAVFGVLHQRHWPYWRWVVAMLLWQSVAQFLFAAHGSLEEPERDGLLMRVMRQATNDGIELAIFAMVFIPLFWGGVIYFARQLYLAAQAPNLGSSAVKPVSGLRKGAELLVITVVTALMFYSSMAALRGSKPAQDSTAKIAAGDSTVEELIDRTIAQFEEQLPKKLDELTVMVAASRSGRTMIIDHKLMAPDFDRATVADFLNNQKMSEACATESTERLLRDGGALRYNYVLSSGGPPLTLDVTAEACAKLAARSPPTASPPSPDRLR